MGITQPVGVIHIIIECETNKTVVRRPVLFIYKMDIVGSDHLDVVLFCQLIKSLVDNLLFFKGFLRGKRHIGGMALNLQIIIVSEDGFVPEYGFFGSLHITFHYASGYFSAKTGSGTNQSLMIFFNQFTVNSRMKIKSLYITQRTKFDQIVVSCDVFCQKDQVIGLLVYFSATGMPVHLCHIDLTPYNGFYIGIFGCHP